jgi:hypothetical protein
MCADDDKILDLIDQAVQGKKGNPTGANQHKGGNRKILPISTLQGKSRSTRYLRQLRKDAPEIHQDVVNGKTSVAVAAIQAGIQP